MGAEDTPGLVLETCDIEHAHAPRRIAPDPIRRFVKHKEAPRSSV